MSLENLSDEFEAPKDDREAVTARRWHDRKAAQALFRSLGYPVTARQLEKLAHSGNGPRFVRFGRRALYDPAELIAWAESRISAPRAHTAATALKGVGA